MRAKAIRSILFATLLFGLMNVCIKFVSDIPSYEIVFFRSIISFIITSVIFIEAKVNPFESEYKFFLFIRGVAGSTALLLFFYTLQNLPLATAVTIQYLAPIFTVIFAAYITHEKMMLPQWFFFLLSLIGIIFIKGFDHRVSVEMLILGVLAAMCSGVSYNAVRKVKGENSALIVVFYLPLTTLPIITPYTMLHWVQPHGMDWFYLILVGLLTQFAQYYMTRAYQLEKASNIANYTYLGILIALGFGYFLFDEHYGAVAICGMFLVISGVLLNYFYVMRVTSLKRFRAYVRNMFYFN